MREYSFIGELFLQGQTGHICLLRLIPASLQTKISFLTLITFSDLRTKMKATTKHC